MITMAVKPTAIPTPYLPSTRHTIQQVGWLAAGWLHLEIFAESYMQRIYQNLCRKTCMQSVYTAEMCTGHVRLLLKRCQKHEA